METIKAETMAEILKLSPEARQNLARALMPQTENKKEKSVEQDQFFEACHNALGLSLRVKRMKAVAECFAESYIDTFDGPCSRAVALSEENYRSLFGAIYDMMVTIDTDADKLHHDLDELYKEA